MSAPLVCPYCGLHFPSDGRAIWLDENTETWTLVQDGDFYQCHPGCGAISRRDAGTLRQATEEDIRALTPTERRNLMAPWPDEVMA